jgi:hypothetical protein
MAQPIEPLRMLATLRSHGASYVLVGAVASAAHGGPIAIDDVDICIPQDQDNLRKLSLALEHLGAEPVGEDAADRSSYDTNAGRLDVIELGPAFAGLYERGSDEDLGGVVARVASMADLMELNRQSGDLVTAAHLAAFADTTNDDATVDVDEYGPATDERDWPNWFRRVWTAFENVDGFLNRTVYGDGHQVRS